MKTKTILTLSAILLVAGAANATPVIGVGSGGSKAEADCGVGAASAAASTVGFLPQADASASGDVDGTSTNTGGSTDRSAWAKSVWSADEAPDPPETTGATWSDASAKHAGELFGAEAFCDFRPGAALLSQLMSEVESFLTGCESSSQQATVVIQGAFGKDDDGNLYIVGHRDGEAFTHLLNDVTFSSETQSQSIPAETSVVGGLLLIQFTENTCSIVAN